MQLISTGEKSMFQLLLTLTILAIAIICQEFCGIAEIVLSALAKKSHARADAVDQQDRAEAV
jgi:hypothetical protein